MKGAQELIIQVRCLPGLRRRYPQTILRFNDLISKDVKEGEVKIEVNE